MIEKTELGFPTNAVHRILRSILSPTLTDGEADAIVICLLSHLLVEDRINEVIFEWLSYDLPFTDPKSDKQRRELLNTIQKLSFSSKYDLIYPVFSELFPAEAKFVWALNKLRVEIFHGRNTCPVLFEGTSLADPSAVEKLFEKSQAASFQLKRFQELVDHRRAMGERAIEKLKQLGLEVS